MQKSINDKYSSGNVIFKQNEQNGALVLGDCNSAVDKHILKPNKVHTIITIGQDALPEKKDENLQYLYYNVLDNKSQKIIQFLDQVYELIQNGRKKGGVLLHCYTGISRSPSFVIAYMMRKKFIPYDQAKNYVKKHRPVAHPNDNFHRQLQNYWKILQKREEQERLRRQKQQRQRQLALINQNQSEQPLTNTSGISKRTLRGVKGAVRSAERSISPKLQAQKVQRKQENSALLALHQIQEKQERKSIEKKTTNEDIKKVYSNKTKVK